MTAWKEGNALFNDTLNTFYLRLDIRDSRYSWVFSVTQTSLIACLMFSTLTSCFQRLLHVFNACLVFSTLASCFQRLPQVFNACLRFSMLVSCFQSLPRVFNACLVFSTLASCFQRLPQVFNACLRFSTLASGFQRLTVLYATVSVHNSPQVIDWIEILLFLRNVFGRWQGASSCMKMVQPWTCMCSFSFSLSNCAYLGLLIVVLGGMNYRLAAPIHDITQEIIWLGGCFIVATEHVLSKRLPKWPPMCTWPGTNCCLVQQVSSTQRESNGHDAWQSLVTFITEVRSGV